MSREMRRSLKAALTVTFWIGGTLLGLWLLNAPRRQAEAECRESGREWVEVYGYRDRGGFCK